MKNRTGLSLECFWKSLKAPSSKSVKKNSPKEKDLKSTKPHPQNVTAKTNTSANPNHKPSGAGKVPLQILAKVGRSVAGKTVGGKQKRCKLLVKTKKKPRILPETEALKKKERNFVKDISTSNIYFFLITVIKCFLWQICFIYHFLLFILLFSSLG